MVPLNRSFPQEKQAMADGRQFDKPSIYKIKVKGGLDETWSDWFDALKIDRQKDETLLTGFVRDQAALHGVLARIRDLGLPLLLVEQINTRVEDEN